MTSETIRSTKQLHLINDGGAFDPGKHPNLMQPEREFNCIAQHVLSVSDVQTWEYQRRASHSNPQLQDDR